ncbi:hypothetical protein [Paenibacillus planticolens]|uniref:Uncharacterized protein n=1 Tax=Paenibacillus planticolens TaxID=2654976 RepID=A0ABX2A0G8_9BACL|nr:hypothetical protein [Paenibacillus planticolens]NOV04835.1 hypothetical protein [Paenibacillus planticolens]
MSATVISLIPTNPEYVPTAKCIEMIHEWIQQYNAQIIITDEVRFIDQGENFEDIKCPFCSSEIEIKWWQDRMEKASESSFHELTSITPCCNQKTTLNELNYNWEAGFARFSIEILNLSIDISEYDVLTIGEQLKCSLKKVIARY